MTRKILLLLTRLIAIQPVIPAKDTDVSVCYAKKAASHEIILATRQHFSTWAASE